MIEGEETEIKSSHTKLMEGIKRNNEERIAAVLAAHPNDPRLRPQILDNPDQEAFVPPKSIATLDSTDHSVQPRKKERRRKIITTVAVGGIIIGGFLVGVNACSHAKEPTIPPLPTPPSGPTVTPETQKPSQTPTPIAKSPTEIPTTIPTPIPTPDIDPLWSLGTLQPGDFRYKVIGEDVKNVFPGINVDRPNAFNDSTNALTAQSLARDMKDAPSITPYEAYFEPIGGHFPEPKKPVIMTFVECIKNGKQINPNVPCKLIYKLTGIDLSKSNNTKGPLYDVAREVEIGLEKP